MFTYEQSTGDLYRDGVLEGRGYSGHGPGLNNPALEAEAMVGPIPAGHWFIGPTYTHPRLGFLTMDLTPLGFDPHGRSLFRIHGDNTDANETASEGCIVLGRALRLLIASSAHDLLVVPGPAPSPAGAKAP